MIPCLELIPYSTNQRVDVKRSREKGTIPFGGFDQQERPRKGRLTAEASILQGMADLDGGAIAESRVFTGP